LFLADSLLSSLDTRLGTLHSLQTRVTRPQTGNVRNPHDWTLSWLGGTRLNPGLTQQRL